MASSRLAGLPAVRKQHLLVEFAGLKQACPEGVLVSLTPGDPSLWSGVLFVRDGPYAPATLRFQISFPDSYPLLPPLVTFSTDMFHPLISPLSTYMYATEVEDDGTVSATDVERLPPGGFSLRHGFPDWFGRGTSSTGGDRKSSGQQDVTQTPPRPINPSLSSGSSKPSAVGESSGFGQTSRKKISTFEVLRYIRSTFDDENVLDSIPLSAAGNPGAWHAWRTHRMENGKVFSDDLSSSDAEDTADTVTTGTKSSADSARKPGEWNWEGVWEERVKKAIAASLSEPVLFGGAGPTDDVPAPQLDGPAAYGSREASSSTYSAHSSDDGTHDPYLLVPNISITPETRTLNDMQSSMWVAIEISGQLSKPSAPDDVHGMQGLNNFMPVHHGGGGLSRYGYLYDIKIDVLPTAHSSVTDIIDDDTRPGSSLLILAYVEVDASKPPLASGKRKNEPDDLIADLEFQLGSVKTEYIQVCLRYCHSGFPMLEDVSTTSGISSRQSRLETAAVGVVKRHSTTSIWSPRPTPPSNALFPIIASHWSPGRAHDVMNKIMPRRSGPQMIPKSNSRSMTNVRGSENSPQTPVRTGKGVPVRVPQRKASLGQQQQSTPDDAMDPARKIWTEMRRQTSDRATASLPASKARRLPTLSTELEPGPRAEMPLLYSQGEVERRRQQIRDVALRNKRSIGADSLRSLVPSLAEFHLDSNGEPDDVIRGQETHSVGRKSEGRWNIGGWW
ncbi:hypothetical protein DL766_007251 [Monosporascus sp. MC13-8B]|uniref:UBC core domain-containing protein n=1 Tax=Monosporascus cannonballus TaxID=155416 RepID=A0ABY0H585_9PEZI|nr:hypothetical protein DL762_006811 [Monosporascus cannonballus]RYO83352.1 hypothetical protein DL763_007887 [Monosporascus cannonballus]RYP24557.1 hypothetical protein DL766_007251 [Monosporascus sp. MC13-8B]